MSRIAVEVFHRGYSQCVPSQAVDTYIRRDVVWLYRSRLTLSSKKNEIKILEMK
jgi:hypothetical protein